MSQDGTENDCFKPVLMMTSLVMPDPETGAAGRIHILVECWNAREQMNVLPLLMSNNSMKMEKNRILFTVYPEAVKVRQIFKSNILISCTLKLLLTPDIEALGR